MMGCQIEGGCHCGQIRYRYQAPLALDAMPVRACSCSFCTRIRASYTSHPDASIDIRLKDSDQVQFYRFDTASADFYICQTCGGCPVVVSNIKDRLYAVVNVNTFDGNPFAGRDVAVANLEGEAKAARLDRRSRAWIGQVTVHGLDN